MLKIAYLVCVLEHNVQNCWKGCEPVCGLQTRVGPRNRNPPGGDPDPPSENTVPAHCNVFPIERFSAHRSGAGVQSLPQVVTTDFKTFTVAAGDAYFLPNYAGNLLRVCTGKQINKKHFQNNSNDIDLWFFCCMSNDLKCLPINFYLLTMFDALRDGL